MEGEKEEEQGIYTHPVSQLRLEKKLTITYYMVTPTNDANYSVELP